MAIESGTSLDQASSGRLDGQGQSDILWLSIHSAEASQRSLALKQLYRDINESRASPQDSMVREALHARIQDSSVEVLQVLYSQPATLLDAFDEGTLLTMVAEALEEDQIPVDRFDQHLSFLLNPFLKQHTEANDNVVRRAIWPFLLHSPSRLAIANSVVKLLAQSKNAGSLLRSIASSATDVKQPAEANDAIANAVATHLVSSSAVDRKDWVEFLISSAQSSHNNTKIGAAASRDLALLSLVHLADQLAGQDFVSVADATMRSIVAPSLSTGGALTATHIKELSGLVLKDTLQSSQHVKHLDTLFKEAATEQSAALLVNYLLVQLVRRVDVPAFDTFLTSQVSTEVQNAKSLLGSLYTVVNTSPLPAGLPKLLLQVLPIQDGRF